MYSVTNGVSTQEFFYLTDANNFLNSNSNWRLLTSTEPRWEISQIKTIKFTDLDQMTIKHDSGSGCSVSVFDSSNQNVECFWEQIDKNTVFIDFGSSISGKVIISAGFSS